MDRPQVRSWTAHWSGSIEADGRSGDPHLVLVDPGCEILRADDLECWIIKITVLGESIYVGGECIGRLDARVDLLELIAVSSRLSALVRPARLA